MMTLIKTEKYDKFVNNIVYSAFFIHQLFFLFSVSALAKNNGNILKIARIVIISSFVIMCMTIIYYFFRGKFSLKEIFIYILIAIPLLISLYNYRVVMVIANLFYAAIFKNVNINKSLNVVLYATIIGYLINVLLGIFTKYTGNVGQVRYGFSRTRYGLGFCYAYFTGYYYLTIVIIYILAHNYLKNIEYIFLMIFNVAIFIFSDAKGAFVYTVVLIFLHLIFVRYNFKCLFSIFRVAVVLSFPVATILAIFLPAFYVQGNGIWGLLNRIVTGRLALTQNSLNTCGWTWFGQSAALWNPGVHWADSAMVLMLIQNGLVVLIMSVVFMTFFSYMAVKINHKPLMIVLFIIAIRSIFDMGFMTMQLGPVIIMFYDVYNKYKNGIVCDY